MQSITLLEGILAGIEVRDLKALPPARLQRLSDVCYAIHLLAEQAAGGKASPRVKPYVKAEGWRPGRAAQRRRRAMSEMHTLIYLWVA